MNIPEFSCLTDDFKNITREPIVVVCGIPRSGTSLMMKMLHWGGLEVVIDEPAIDGKYYSYETAKILKLPKDHAFLSECEGKAIKILDPIRARPPVALYSYRFIWLRRDPIEQAKSQRKFMKVIGGVPLYLHPTVKALAKSIVKDTQKTLPILSRYPYSALMEVEFSDLISAPARIADQLCAFLDRGLDRERMISAVIPREVGCLPYMLEVELIKQELEEMFHVSQSEEKRNG